MLLRFYIFCFFLFFCFVPSALSQEKEIRIGYVSGFKFVRNLNIVGNNGYLYEITKELEKHLDYTFDYVQFFDYNTMALALENQEIDFIAPYPQTLDDNNFLDLNLFGKFSIVLASKLENKSIYFNDPKSINGKTVASFYNSPFEKVLDAYCKEHGIEVTYIRAFRKFFQDLPADLYLTSDIFEKFNEVKAVKNLGYYSAKIMANSENKELTTNVSKAFEKIALENVNFFDFLFAKYFSNNNPKRALTREQASLLAGKVFSVGYVNDHKPIQYRDADGKNAGISIEILNDLAKQYNFSLEFFPYDLKDPQEAHQQYDLLISLQGDLVHDRTYFLLSDSYLNLPLMLITGNKVKDLQSKSSERIGMLRYHTLNFDSIKEEYHGSEILFYNSFNEILSAYLKGDITQALVSNAGAGYIKTLLDYDYYTFGTKAELSLRLFVSKKLGEKYLEGFNAIFSQINPHDYDNIVFNYAINSGPRFTIINVIRLYVVEIFFIVFICLIGLLAYRKYTPYIKAQLAKKEAEKEEQRRVKIIEELSTKLDSQKHEEASFEDFDLYQDFFDLNMDRFYDELTGLMTERFLKEEVLTKLVFAKPNEYEFISMDIDSFNSLANYFNNEKSSEVLKIIGESLQIYFSGQGVLISRASADYFYIFRKHEGAEDIIDVLNNHVIPYVQEVLDQTYTLNYSLGTYVIDNCEQEYSAILDKANMARQKGKSKHETTHYYFDEKMLLDYDKGLTIRFNMERALKAEEFFLVYQPKIDFQSLKVVGAEALVRWVFSSGETVYPSDFIPFFEKNNFIVKLDLYVFEKLCNFISQNSANQVLPTISANLSAITMLDENLPADLDKICTKYGVQPSQIELEITESAMVEAEKTVMRSVKTLRKMGFKISIDDFGTGVSSLNRLGSIDADIVKIDKSFLDIALEEVRNEIVIEKTLDMAKSLNLKVVAEGVETRTQALWLQKIGCDIAQGYYFSKPISEADFIALIGEDKQFYI